MRKFSVRLTNEQWGWLFVAGLAFCGGLQLLRGFVALFGPVSTDYSEMMVAGMARQWLDSGRLAFSYTPPDAPYGMPGVQYPPLFIGLTAVLMKASGLGAVLAARLLAWAAYAAAGAMVGLLVWRETAHKKLAVYAACFPFTFWSVLIFINGARPDPLALFLSLLAVYIYRGGRERQNPALIKLVIVALTLALAFYAKQTYLAAAAAIFFDLALARGRRRYALFFGGAYAGLGLIGLGICQVASEGQFVGIFEPGRAGRFIFHLAPAMLGFFLLDHAPLIILAGLALGWQWRRGQLFWPLYAFFATLACSSIVKDGAVDYYFNEVAYLLSVQAALGIMRFHSVAFSRQLLVGSPQISGSSPPVKAIIEEREAAAANTFTKVFPQIRPSPAIVNGLLAVQLVIAIGMLVGWNQGRDNDSFGRVDQEARAIVEQYQQSGKPALIFQNNLLLDTNQVNLIGDYFIYWILIGNGQRDIGPLQRDLENRRYELILVGSPEFRRWPPALNRPLEAGYNLRILAGSDGRPLYWLYQRKPE